MHTYQLQSVKYLIQDFISNIRYNKPKHANEEIIITGSAAMVLHDLKDACERIKIGVSKDFYEHLTLVLESMYPSQDYVKTIQYMYNNERQKTYKTVDIHRKTNLPYMTEKLVAKLNFFEMDFQLSDPDHYSRWENYNQVLEDCHTLSIQIALLSVKGLLMDKLVAFDTPEFDREDAIALYNVYIYRCLSRYEPIDLSFMTPKQLEWFQKVPDHDAYMMNANKTMMISNARHRLSDIGLIQGYDSTKILSDWLEPMLDILGYYKRTTPNGTECYVNTYAKGRKVLKLVMMDKGRYAVVLHDGYQTCEDYKLGPHLTYRIMEVTSTKLTRLIHIYKFLLDNIKGYNPAPELYIGRREWLSDDQFVYEDTETGEVRLVTYSQPVDNRRDIYGYRQFQDVLIEVMPTSTVTEYMESTIQHPDIHTFITKVIQATPTISFNVSVLSKTDDELVAIVTLNDFDKITYPIRTTLELLKDTLIKDVRVSIRDRDIIDQAIMKFMKGGTIDDLADTFMIQCMHCGYHEMDIEARISYVLRSLQDAARLAFKSAIS